MIKKKTHSAREQAKELIHRATTLGDTVVSGLGSLVAS
jgi:hypothetical protein